MLVTLIEYLIKCYAWSLSYSKWMEYSRLKIYESNIYMTYKYFIWSGFRVPLPVILGSFIVTALLLSVKACSLIGYNFASLGRKGVVVAQIYTCVKLQSFSYMDKEAYAQQWDVTSESYYMCNIVSVVRVTIFLLIFISLKIILLHFESELYILNSHF